MAISTLYLKVLFAQGLPAVPHCTTPAIYKYMLDGKGIPLEISDVPVDDIEQSYPQKELATVPPPCLADDPAHIDDFGEGGLDEEIDKALAEQFGFDIPESQAPPVPSVPQPEPVAPVAPVPQVPQVPPVPPALMPEVVDANVGREFAIEMAARGTKWGVFAITPAAGGRFGSFQIACPLHKKNRITGCKKNI